MINKAEILKSRCAVVIDLGTRIDTLHRKHTEYLVALLAHVEAASDVEALTVRHQESQDMLEASQAEVRRLDISISEMRHHVQSLHAAFNKLNDDKPDLVQRFSDLSGEEQNRTPEEHDAEIDATTARLDFLHEGNPRAIREYDDRATRIEALQEKIAEHDEFLVRLSTQISELRAKWEPRLDALVARISAAFGASFEKIGCAGEVSVYKTGPSSDGANEAEENNAQPRTSDSAYKDNDFEAWAIHISVKFREDESLSLLDSHRQSGGERAVSTIFYLMALQQLSRAPFRVVDEINQGMDPRNERVVHERLVDLACGLDQEGQDEQVMPIDDNQNESGGSSQYFLITPKLLGGLKYVPGMKVLNIVSGEWLPENNTGMEMDFGKLAKLRKQLVACRDGYRGGSSPLVNGVGA